MSKNYSNLKIKRLGLREWKLIEDWITPYGVVPEGFQFNGADIPRVFWLFDTPEGLLFEASILHDFYYKTTIRSKEFSDLAFKSVALDNEVNKTYVNIAYMAVKLLGKGNY